jgi:hypothetical protein
MRGVRNTLLIGSLLIAATAISASIRVNAATRAFPGSTRAGVGASGPGGPRHFSEIRRMSAAEADQAVAVDARHFYAIDNRAIGKYDKRTGEKIDEWVGADGGPIIHLNSGIVVGGRLYCAHSNYPAVPMLSSIEIFDAGTLDHVQSHSFGMFPGSATWIDRRDGHWWVGFANYRDNGGSPGRGPEWTTVAVFDDYWRQVGGYAFPASIVERFADHSNSGGAFGPDGNLWATGHDAAEIYVLRPPHAGSALELLEILPVTAEGQGFAWDRAETGTIWTILRRSNTVVVSRLVTD